MADAPLKGNFFLVSILFSDLFYDKPFNHNKYFYFEQKTEKLSFGSIMKSIKVTFANFCMLVETTLCYPPANTETLKCNMKPKNLRLILNIYSFITTKLQDVEK